MVCLKKIILKIFCNASPQFIELSLFSLVNSGHKWTKENILEKLQALEEANKTLAAGEKQ